MKTIYIDADYKCHVRNDGTMTAVETDSFDGKCDVYIEGFCYEDTGNGVVTYPWKPYDELDNAQREYEKALIADMQNALNTLGVTLDE